MREELWCKAGSHFWHREATRGRKPIACPEHREALVPPTPTPTRGLSDEQKRVAQEAYEAIPRYTYVRDEVIRVVGLGHYTSPPSLYQALVNFLKKPALDSPTEHVVPRDPFRGSQSTTVEEDKPKQSSVTVRSRYELDEIIERHHPDYETRLKLEFIDKRLKDQASGRIQREQADINLLIKTQRDLVRGLERQHRRAA